jgi:hypothetical protein
LSDAFYRKLERYADEAGVTKEEFLTKAIEAYIWGIRKKLTPLPIAEQIRRISSTTAKAWWDKLSPEEKRARALKAVEARRRKKTERDKQKPPAKDEN